MNRIITFFLFFSLSHTVFGGIIRNVESESLHEISRKLQKIDEKLRNQKLYISSAVFQWEKLDAFKAELLYAVAHDPAGAATPNSDPALHPTAFTKGLQESWAAIETDVLGNNELRKSAEWAEAKAEMDNFLLLRQKNHYQVARMQIKSGVLLGKLQQLKTAAAVMTKEAIKSHDIGVKVMDPFIEKLSEQLGELSRHVRKLVEINTPAPQPPRTIFDPAYSRQMAAFALGCFLFSVLFTLTILWARRKVAGRKKKNQPVTVKTAFNYYEWLKKFEANLQRQKRSENDFSEHLIELREFSGKIAEGIKALNEASGQEEYYAAVESLNEAIPKFEKYLQRLNGKKHFEASRKIISQCIEVCEAIEAKKEFYFEDQAPNLRQVKLEKTIYSKAS